MFSFCIFFFFFFFYPTPVGDSQKGKRKTSEQAVLSDSNTRSERQKKMMYFGGHSLEEAYLDLFAFLSRVLSEFTGYLWWILPKDFQEFALRGLSFHYFP